MTMDGISEKKNYSGIRFAMAIISLILLALALLDITLISFIASISSFFTFILYAKYGENHITAFLWLIITILAVVNLVSLL